MAGLSDMLNPRPGEGVPGPGPEHVFLVIRLPRAQGCLHSQAEKAMISGIIHQTQENTSCRKLFPHQHGDNPGVDLI